MKKCLAFYFIFFLCLIPSYGQDVNIVKIDDYIINPVVEEYVKDAILQSEQENSILIIEINTPGGLLKTTQNIVQYILNSEIPIVAYISPTGARAASAGTFISYACNLIAMAPSTRIGAAHPVMSSGKIEDMSQELQKKILNDTLAWAKNISEKRNRPYGFIEKAISESISITETQAKEQKVADLIAQDLNDLLKKTNNLSVKTIDDKEIIIDSAKGKINFIEFNSRQKILNFLVDPTIAYLFFTLGFLGLIFEVTHPGFGIPGIFGAISLIIAFYAFQILPVNYAGVILVALGLLFFIVEAFTPTFGIFTLGGISCFVLGSVILFKNPFLKVSLKVILPLVSSIALWSIFILSAVIKERMKKPLSGIKSFINKTAKTLSRIDKVKGKVFINGEIWDARSNTEIEQNQEVIVERIDNLTLWVKKNP